MDWLASWATTTASGNTCTSRSRASSSTKCSRFRSWARIPAASKEIRTRSYVIGGCSCRLSRRSIAITIREARCRKSHTCGTASPKHRALRLRSATRCCRIGYVFARLGHGMSLTVHIVLAVCQRFDSRNSTCTRVVLGVPGRARAILYRSPVHDWERYLGHARPDTERVERGWWVLSAHVTNTED